MISLGKNIKQQNDPLEKISLKMLADKIRKPMPKFVDFINQLRKMQSIDTKQYRQYKTKLPYVVAAVFNPKFRKIENFANTSYFILDIDHLMEKDIDMDNMFNKIKQDERVALMFRSPSNDGIKVFFKLKEPFYDHGKYSMFYKLFAHKFGEDYQLSQVIDKRTSDVSRACFVSYDPQIWYNANCIEVDTSAYVNFDNQLQLGELSQMLKENDKNLDASFKGENIAQDMPDDIIAQIREKLNPKLKVKREKNIIIPEQLNTIVDLVRVNLLEYEIEIDEIVDINYGKQFRVKLAHRKAEVNIFYGKKGFTVVKSSKSGLNPELVEITADVINSVVL